MSAIKHTSRVNPRSPSPVKNPAYQAALAERDRANVTGTIEYFGEIRKRAANGPYITAKDRLFLTRRVRRQALREGRE